MNLIYICLIAYISLFFIHSLDQKRILLLTDIHLDPLYNTHIKINQYCRNSTDYSYFIVENFDYGRYGCDTSINLFNSFLDSINKEQYDLIIINGDQIAHNLFKTDRKKEDNIKLFRDVFRLIYSSLKKKVNVTILPVIGNNDFYEHYDYPSVVSRYEQTSFFKDLYFNDENINIQNLNSDISESLNIGMYYSYRILNMKFIFMNSIIFSVKNGNFDKNSADHQIRWLESELINLKIEENAIILMHITPYPYYYNGNVEFFFRQEYAIQLDDIMYKYRDKISNVFGSHIHWNKSGIRIKSDIIMPNKKQLLKDSELDFILNNIILRSKKILSRSKAFESIIAMYFNTINFSAFSPVYNNNPSYSIIIFNEKERRIENIITKHADLKKTLSFDEADTLNIPQQIWDIDYDYRKDFKFTNFDNHDFYDFIYKRIKDLDINRTYLYFLGGFPRYNKDYYKKLISQMGDINDIRMYCVFKIISPNELEYCKELDYMSK